MCSFRSFLAARIIVFRVFILSMGGVFTFESLKQSTALKTVSR